jgi:8-oxo-dGTP diphosphatase
MKSSTVVAAVILENGHVLIARRKHGELAGLWEFPGGKVEPGETAERGLVREIHEELCIDIEVGDFFQSTQIRKMSGCIELIAYFCSRRDCTALVLKDHTETAWVNVKTIGNYPFVPADTIFVEKLLSGGWISG